MLMFFSPAAWSNSDKIQSKLANGNFERAASQFPSSKPRRPHFWGWKHQGRNVACLPLWTFVWACSPQKGAGHTLLCAPWVLNKYLLAGWPAQMWEQCVFFSELGEIYPPNHFIWFKARSHKSACLAFGKQWGWRNGRRGKTRTVRGKARGCREHRMHYCTGVMK